ncbi:hypothetical protein QVD17_01582 [Tagetes erecta]|uniref:RING-type E3 ubiquitin transferase n=1 Tax=Tagetes erecta TaxID=13708 RepID=A0AAD8P6Z4_TARER|nr:hypothetical protein QVD17_01582 [Tagetes erecta]
MSTLGSSISSSSSYWCYRCNRFIRVRTNSGDSFLSCPDCNGGFVEQINSPNRLNRSGSRSLSGSGSLSSDFYRTRFPAAAMYMVGNGQQSPNPSFLMQRNFLPRTTTKHDGDGSLVVVRNQLHMFVANSLPNWSLHLWRMDGENWTKIWVRQNILPPSLFGRTITYVVSTGKFLVVSRSGTVFQIDTTKNGIECYHPVFSESSIQGAVYTETLMSPDF